jgi:hypothetical protein
MSNGPWWANSPIVVVPLAFVALGLTLVPFAVADVDHAAQFYGSLVAAFIAAGAIIGTTTMQARFARFERQRQNREEMIAGAVELYGWLAALLSDIAYALRIFEMWRDNGIPRNLVLGDVRKLTPSDGRERLRNRLTVAASIPSPLGHGLVMMMHEIDTIFDKVENPRLEATTTVEMSFVKRRSTDLSWALAHCEWQRAQLAKFLVAEGAIGKPGKQFEAVLAKGAPNREEFFGESDE